MRHSDYCRIVLSDRLLGFEVIVTAIMTGGLVANMPHPHRDRYPHQRILINGISLLETEFGNG